MNKKLYLVADGEIAGLIAWTQSAIGKIIPKKKDPWFKDKNSSIWEVRKNNRERFVEFAVKCLEEVMNPKEELYGYFTMMGFLERYLFAKVWFIVLTDKDPCEAIGGAKNG